MTFCLLLEHVVSKYQFNSLWFDPTVARILESIALEANTLTITPPIWLNFIIHLPHVPGVRKMSSRAISPVPNVLAYHQV
jgi:hypothetical protein